MVLGTIGAGDCVSGVDMKTENAFETKTKRT